MSCLYSYNGNWYTKEELKDLLVSQDIELFEPLEGVETSYDAYINYKKNLVFQLENRLNQIKKAKKDNSDNLEYIKKLIELENKIVQRLEGSEDLGLLGLKAEIITLEDAPPISRLDYYIEQDIERLSQLAKSTNEQDLNEARSIIDFYEGVGKFDVTKEHPLFENSQIFDANGNFILPSDIRQKLEFYSQQANSYNNLIKKQEEVRLTELVNSNSKIKNITQEKLEYDDIFSKESGLKDVAWIDLFVMDITNGIFSDNGLVPQVAINTLQNTVQSKLVQAKSVENKINNIQIDLQKEITNLDGGKYRLDALGILGVQGVSFELFRAKNKQGLLRDNITQRFTPEFFQERSKMLDSFNNAIGQAIIQTDPAAKAKLFSEAYQKRNNWYRNNTIVLDPSSLPEVISSEDFKEFESFFKADKSQNYKSKLIETLGEQGYSEEVEKQLKLLRDYKVSLEVFKDGLVAEYKVEDSTKLPLEGKTRVENWITRNNPFLGSELKPLQKGKAIMHSTMGYNYAVPRKNKIKAVATESGPTLQETNEDTGYYDERFKQIEANPTLKEFHNILLEVTQMMYDVLPSDVRQKFSPTSIPALKKNLAEILFDDTIPLLQKISKIYKEIIDNIKAKFGINVQEAFSTAKVDPITGKPNYRVNDSFFKSNRDEINKKYDIEVLKLKQTLGFPIHVNLKGTLFRDTELTENAKQILVENLNMDFSTIVSTYGRNLDVAKLLRDGITHQVVQENSFDLPKILKMYSFLSMEYAARQEVLPILNIVKNHYEQIKKPATTNIGESIINSDGKTRFDGERKNANRQFESWFERVVLGNYGSKNELGDDRIKRIIKLGITPKDKQNSFQSKLQTTITGKILRTDEKILKAKIPEIVKELKAAITTLEGEEKKEAQKVLNRVLNIEKNLGKDFSVAASFDALFNFIRLLGLGWNVSSYITNFLEGQIANFTVAATGDYFTSENLYRANDIVKGSFLKNITFDKVATPGAKKARVLMDRYRILQDASNELQKASTKTTFSKFKKLSPYEGTRRTEYLNQTPLMIAILLDQKIVSKNGEESNVWDAMDSEGKLLEDFKTEENVQNWENANGETYNDFSSLITKTIVNAHGDYDQLRGNVASEFILGKALLMFKRWMARQFYQRFGKEQIDLEAGVTDFKGRYRSHTAATGAIHGGVIGFAGLSLFGAGPLGLLIGGTGGLLLAKLYGANTTLPLLKELTIVSKEIMMNLARIPTNTITGKATLKDINLDTLEGLKMRDVKNLQSNLIDISITLGWTALLLFSKALLWDDEDDEDSVRRQTHNLLANRFMQLAGQSAQYINPVDTWNNTLGSVATVRFLDNVGKTAVKAQNLLEGRDILQSGPNAGESAFYNQFKRTFFPGILKDNVGFSTQLQRQFKPSPFDTWFFGDEKKAEKEVRRIRAKEKRNLEDQGLKDKALRDALNKKYPVKKKGESYEDVLKRYNN